MTEEGHVSPANMPERAALKSAGPVKESERIEIVDILRGFAIFGILLVNMYGFAGMDLNPQTYSGLNQYVVLLILLLAQAKFYSLFSFLFGWGMWIQMSRAIRRSVNFVPVYVRRMIVLLAIGIIHGIFIWTGDILAVYAILGLLLLLLRNRSERVLIIAIGLLLILPMVLNLPGEGMASFRNWYAETTEFLRNFGSQRGDIYGSGSYWEITERRLQEFVGGQTWFIYWIGNVFSMFLLGYLAGKRGVFQDIRANLSLFRRTMWISLIVGLVLNGISVYVAVRPEIVPAEWQRFVRISSRTIGAPALMLFYVSGITVLAHRETWHNRLAVLAPVGRMALTNYLMQSVIATLIFYSYGLGLFGSIGPTVGLIITILIYLVQIRLSAWWLERYRFGPMEWLWRTLTYLRPQPLRRGEGGAGIPGSNLVRRATSKIPTLVILVVIWIGLAIWAVALLRWNASLNSEIYTNPFETEDTDVSTAQSSATSVSEDDSQDDIQEGEGESVVTAIMPEVRTVEYRPGPIAASGDLGALVEAFDASQALQQIDILSQPRFAGRQAGSPGGYEASRYIADKMAEYGLQPAGEDGTYFQPFPITYTLLTETPELQVYVASGSSDENYVLYEDFAPVISGYAGGGYGKGELYWVEQCQDDDFMDLDLVGKVIFCLAPSSGQELLESSRRALEYGAAGLLLLTDEERRPADFGSRYTEVWVPESIPVMFVYSDVAEKLLAGSGIALASLAEAEDPFPLQTQAELWVETSETTVVSARNVLGVLPGRDPAFSDEVVIIGGHYDHLGQGPDGTFWPGANDNASGIAGMLEIARSWHEQGFVPRRTVVFAAWDAEEWGLIGSTAYVFRPSFPLEKTVAAIQMDMIGTGTDVLNIAGDEWLSNHLFDNAQAMAVDAAISDLGRSDHVPFNMAGVPSSLLIWLSEDEPIEQYHRPQDTIETIDPDKLGFAANVAEMTLLQLAESEPAIQGMLADRARAAQENDRAAFLSTSTGDQSAVDSYWLADIQQYKPSRVEITSTDLKITGEKASGEVHFRVEYPDPAGGEETMVISVDLPVQFERRASDWLWAGPDLELAEIPEDEQTAGSTARFTVAYPVDVEVSPWTAGVEASRQYSEIAGILNLPARTESRILLLPDRESIRVSTALSLPSEQASWVEPEIIKLAYSENISKSVEFSDALVQLLLANSGVTESAAPWLWRGLPVAIAAERDLVAVHSANLPVLQEFLAGEIDQAGRSEDWAAVEFLKERAGWQGVGQFIRELASACRLGLCEDTSGQDAALQSVLGMGTGAFAQGWQESWRGRLQAVQSGLDENLQRRTAAVREQDENAFLATTAGSEPSFVNAQKHWFAALDQHPAESFSLSAHPLALLPGGDVLAEVTMQFQLAGDSEQIDKPLIRFEPTGSGYLWAGSDLETVAGSLLSLRFPAGNEALAQQILAQAERSYRQLAGRLGINAPEPVVIELLSSDAEMRAAIALSYPDGSAADGWSRSGTAIMGQLLAISDEQDYRSMLAVQMARQLLYQQGVNAEWLLLGVSSYLARPLDNGVTQRRIALSLDDLVTRIEQGIQYDLSEIPGSIGISRTAYELARVQSWDSVRFFVSRYGWDALLDLIRMNGSGEDLDSSMREVTGEDLSSFSREWSESFLEGHMPADALDLVSEVDEERAFEHVAYLTGPELEGRLAGTEGSQDAALYISERFAEYGLVPAGDGGETYQQTFSITTTGWLVEPFLEIAGDPQPYRLREDMLFSRATVASSDGASGEMIWVGEEPLADEDLAGQIMVSLAIDDLQEIVDRAEEAGAAGLILLGIKDEIEEIYAKNPLRGDMVAELPVLELTKDGTLRILETMGFSYMEASQLEGVVPLNLSARMGASFEESHTVPTSNVLGLLPGSDPDLSGEYIIIGAHYDHVGDDPPTRVCGEESTGSSDSPDSCEEQPGQRYSGANDDASGVGVMLELARIWHEAGYRPKRSILFAAWGAQEYGELGSRHFVVSPTVSLTNSLAMFQLDGLGGGGGFAPGIQANEAQDALLLFQVLTAADILDLDVVVTDHLQESDHLPFSRLGFPVLLYGWRLADENNLPDEYADGVHPDRMAQMGYLVALTAMMLGQ